MIRSNHRSKKLDDMLGKNVRLTTFSGVHEGILRHDAGWYYMKPTIWMRNDGKTEHCVEFRFRKTHIKKAEVILDDKVR